MAETVDLEVAERGVMMIEVVTLRNQRGAGRKSEREVQRRLVAMLA